MRLVRLTLVQYFCFAVFSSLALLCAGFGPGLLLDMRVQQAVSAASKSNSSSFYFVHEGLPDTKERTQTKAFTEDWLGLAFDFWSDSSELSHRFASAMMSADAADELSKVLWTSKMDKGVARAFEFNSDSSEVVSDDGSGLMSVKTRGSIYKYDSCGGLSIELLTRVRNRGGKRTIESVQIDTGALGLGEFVKKACKIGTRTVEAQSILFFEEAQSHFVKSEDADVLFNLDEACRLSPGFARAYEFKGFVLRQMAKERPHLSQRFYSEACSAFSKAIQLCSGDAECAVRFRYECNFELGRYSEAVRDCNIALTKRPNDAEFLTKRGVARYQLNDVPGAISDLSQCIVFNPSFPRGYAELGRIRWKQGHVDTAISLLQKSLAVLPNEYAYLYLGQIYRERRQYDDAIVSLSAGTVFAGFDHSEISFELARAYSAIGSYDKAVFNFDIGNHWRANAFSLTECASIKFYDLHDLKGALDCLDRALVFDPSYAVALEIRSNVLYALGRREESQHIEEMLSRINCICPQDLQMRARAKAYLEDLEGAQRDYTSAIEWMKRIDVNDSSLICDLYDDRGRTRFAKGDLIGSAQDLIRCVARRIN